MLRRLLAIAVPLSAAAVAQGSSAALTGPSASSARIDGPVASGAALQWAPQPRPVPAVGLSRPGTHPGGPGHGSAAASPASPSGVAQKSADSPLFGATGDAVNLDPLATCIGCTGAGAAPGDSSAYSRSIKVADESVAEGESPANGYTSGATVSLPPNSLLGLAIGSWSADNHHDATSAEGHSFASAGRLAVADGRVATVDLLDARSDATRTRSAHHATASSDALRASVLQGQVMIVVLHSDTASDGPGHVYIAQLNNNRLMTSDELMGGIPLAVPNVATVNLLRGGPDRAVVCELMDGKSNGAAEIGSTSTGNASGPRNQTH